jgi:4-amino-4-deoxy-L-arabinose transferase-like glycosyltransferase
VRSAPAVIGLLLAWLGFGLVGHDPWKPDEAYTFGLVHHIVETGDWVVPTLGGEPFVEKPPLFFVTAALFAQLFGQWLPLHDAARLASGFYAGLAFLFLGLTARVLYGSGAAWSAVLLLAGSLGYVVHAHQLITDNALVAGIALGLYGLSIALSRPALGGALLGTGAGIAFLSKGVLGPGMLGLIALLLPVFPAWRKREYARSLLWAAAAFAPWALLWPTLLYRRSPPLFDEWLWTNNFGRFTGSAGLGGVLDHWLYLKNLPWFALPTLPVAAWALWRALRSDIQTAGLQLPLVAFLVMLAVLSAASSARTLYGLPMLLPLALLAAATVDALPAWLERPLEYLGMWGAALGSLLLWILWLALVSGWPAALAARLESASPGYVPGVGALPLALAIALTAGWLFLVLPAPRSLAVTWAAGIALVWGLAMTLWLPYLDHSKSYRGVILDMKKTLPAGACVASRNLTEPQRAMFHYFAGVVSLRDSSPAAGQCTALLVHTPTNAEPPHGAEWKLAWRGTRPGDDKEHFWLFSR